MQFEAHHLSEADETPRVETVMYCSGLVPFFTRTGTLSTPAGMPFQILFLEEAGLAAAFPGAHDAQRPVGDVRQQMIGDGVVYSASCSLVRWLSSSRILWMADGDASDLRRSLRDLDGVRVSTLAAVGRERG